jgi:tRNA nucleotidyltransferase (CCA-adding enzyme)
VTLHVADLAARLRSAPVAALPLRALAGEPGVWVVGGAVRDLLLGREPDGILDVVVEGDAVAVARRAARRVGGRLVVHERFGTATVTLDGAGFDVAAARRETYPAPGALPEVEVGATLREDLARRDVTVNAIALRLADGELAAWEGALDDLEAGVLRVLHDGSFREDPTRLLRMARYAARLGFAVEEHTARLAREAVRAGAPATVTGSRLGAELRLALREPQPAALTELERFGVGRAVVHERFAVDRGLVERALALAPDDARADLVALAAACARVPPDELAARLDALEFTARERATVVAAVRGVALADRLAAADSDVGIWRLLRREPPEAVALAGAADPGAEGRARRWLGELRHVRLAITGDDLVAAGLRGPAVGRGLEAALEALLDGAAPEREAQLATALRAQP